MTQQKSSLDSTRDAYDAIAPIYDDFSAGNDHEIWLGEVLLPELEKHGLTTGRALDVGCGTGRAFGPLQRRGWSVDGCDVSPGMIAQARDKHRGSFEGLYVADARELPRFVGAPYDLVLALNDVVNYLTEDGDLEQCFRGVARNLAPGGLVCFDANNLIVYEQDWLAGTGETMSDRGWNWKGLTEEAAPGRVFEAEVGGRGIESSVHCQRHWTRRSIETAMKAAGLVDFVILGQRGEGPELALDGKAADALHYKLIYIATGA